MLKVGDEIEILKTIGSGAVSDMNKYLGKKTRVSEVRPSGGWVVLEDAGGWNWKVDWLRKIDALKDESEEI